MNKILFFTLILITPFLLSSCTVKDQLKSKILNKVETKVIEEKSELSDDQLLQQLESSDTSVDTDINALEKDLQ